MAVTEREFEMLQMRVAVLEQKQAGTDANVALFKFLLPTLISISSVVYAVWSSQ